jgi:hypothetical protein
MPKKIHSFTIHIKNRHTSVEEMKEYLTKTFGPDRSEDNNTFYWYIGRNYERPSRESHLEIKFYSEFSKKHTLMMFEHPFSLIHEDAEEWHEINDELFSNLFDED